MTTTIIAITFIVILILGYRIIRKQILRYTKDCDFAAEYRNAFVEFANIYMSGYDSWTRVGKIDNEKYIWLAKNVNKMQENLGGHGKMFYIAPFRTHQIPRYEIVINTLPKFREGNIKEFDLNSVDDCLIRYIGALEDVIGRAEKKLKSPIIWFKEGFQELVSFPVYLLNWFGLVSEKNVFRITSNLFYKIISGVGGLVAL